MPKKLLGRFVMILFVPLMSVQIVLSYIFFDRHTEEILRGLSQTIGGDIAMITHMTEGVHDFVSLQRKAKEYMHLDITLLRDRTLDERGQAKDTWLYEHLNAALQSKLHHPYYFEMTRKTIIVYVQVPEGVLVLKTLRKRLFSKTTYLVLIWTAASAFLLFIVAVLFMRNQVKPIRRLAEASERFGKGFDITPFKSEGAVEVRQAAQAFHTMQKRIARFVEERTQQLAAVSHDLRTPLTRMKLQLSLMEQSDARRALLEDVADMQHMIQGFLDFARTAIKEESVPVRLDAYLKRVCAMFPSPDTFLNQGPFDAITLTLKPHLFQRCVLNILANANAYATRARIHTQKDAKHVCIIFDDNGPGIEEKYYDDVFTPFKRLDASRNSETGGSGLGLSIVRDIMHHHGGRVHLSPSPLGGLRVTLLLPY